MKKLRTGPNPVAVHPDGRPVFAIDASRPNRDFPGCLVVEFKCTCGRVHEHGWGLDEDPARPQHRSAHCAEGPLRDGGYYIVLTPALTPAAGPSRARATTARPK